MKITFFFIYSNAEAQMYFQQSCTGALQGEVMYGLTPAPNGTLIMAGQYGGGTFLNEVIPMFSLDTTVGSIRWANIVGGPPRVHAWGIDEVSDGVIVGGDKIVNSTNISGLVFKTDTSGNVVWARELPGTQKYVFGIKATRGNGAVVCGSQDMEQWSFISKLDGSGNVLWQKKYQFTTTYNRFLGVTVAHDQGYLAVGYTDCPTCTDQSNIGAVIKTDSNGVMQWSKTFAESAGCYFFSSVETHDHGFAIVGSLGHDPTLLNDSGYSCLFILKLDSLGNTQWCNYYPAGSSFGANVIQETGEQELIVSGSLNTYTYPFGRGVLFVTNFFGTTIYANTMKFAGSSGFFDMRAGPQRTVYLTGFAASALRFSAPPRGPEIADFDI